jgi:hypothetical protein
MPDSLEAKPELVTLQLYKTKDGQLYPNDLEGLRCAIYQNCTHRPCECCGEPIEKMYAHCQECREKRDMEQYLKRNFIDWDREIPLYSEANDIFFFDIDDLRDYCAEHDKDPLSLRLLLCEPILAKSHSLDYDHFADSLSEDMDTPDELLDTLDAFNLGLENYKAPLSWEPGKYRVTVYPENLE